MPLRVLTLTETVDGATYTAVTSIPPNWRLMDVYLETDVAWTAATCPVDVGDLDGADSLAAAVDLASQQGIAGKDASGTDWGNGLTDADGPVSSSGPGKLYPSGSIITAVASPTVPGGPTGVSRVTLLLEAPTTQRRATVAT